MQEYLKRRILSVMQELSTLPRMGMCRNNSTTTGGYPNEVMGRDLDYEICIPCVVQWSMLWFSAPTRLNQTLEGEDINIVRYHEVVNMGDRRSDLYALRRFPHTAYVHVDNSDCSLAKNTQVVACKQGNEGLGLCFCLLSMMVAQKILMNDVFWNPLQVMSPFHSREMHRVSISPSVSSARREPVSKVRKNSAILKRAMTEWRTDGQEGIGIPNPRAIGDPRRGEMVKSSHDTWKSSKPKGKSKAISAEMDALRSALKEKSNTWTKSCKESFKRETELFKMIEIAAKDEKQRGQRKKHHQEDT